MNIVQYRQYMSFRADVLVKSKGFQEFLLVLCTVTVTLKAIFYLLTMIRTYFTK